jgi:hypothetical protein
MLFILSSCKDYIPPKVSCIKIKTDLNVFSVNYCLEGMGKTKYQAKIVYKNHTIYSTEISEGYSEMVFDFSLSSYTSDKLILPMLIDNSVNSKIDFKVSIFNARRNFLYDTIISCNPSLKHIPNIEVTSNTIAKSKPQNINRYLLEIRKYINDNNIPFIGNIDSVALLYAIVKNDSIDYTVDSDSIIPIYEPKKSFNIEFKTDTKFEKNYVFMNRIIEMDFGSNSKPFYEPIKSLKALSNQLLSLPGDEIPNNCKLVENYNSYTLVSEIKSVDSDDLICDIVYFGLNGNGSSYIQTIGRIIYDNSSPTFSSVSNIKFRNFEVFSKDSYKGSVILDTKDFQGWNPYNIPFVGHVYGDVSELYVNNIKKEFEIGKEVYFKQRLNLDLGYNRVPIKIIDKRGNITESFIEISMERIKNKEIEIDNDIYIDN